MEFLQNYGLFLAKTVTIVVALFFLTSGIAGLIRRERSIEREKITVKRLNSHYDQMARLMKYEMLPTNGQKQAIKEERKKRKAEKKEAKKREKTEDEDTQSERKRIFTITFKGDILASAVQSIREEITAILMIVQEDDEVVLKLESSGGAVHAYGLAASQLTRLKDKNIPITVCVDKVAASGGYMMACVGNRILAAPFAIVGSIGVASEFPNFHKLLKKHDVDYELMTAGEHKRTMTMFGENNNEVRKKFTEQLDDTHALFKDFVKEHRETVDVGKVATGEYWYGKRALDLNLVDELRTSDDYLLAARDDADIYEITYKEREKLREKIAAEFESVFSNIVYSLWNKITRKPLA